ncbi:5-guanidino-2-oxopentanoate decarboxylase [Thioclava sp. FR2]|uniref:5-guanidino-2-oxopentanoate decarboxylase n=1 Tax=Thioclava sp. FR2 TaxID=3445780 RepID=UPI003EBBE64C
MKTVGERLVEGLAARGVEVVFGIPGVHTVELYRGLSGSPIRHVTARHEQGAAFMADGYARVSGKPGVAFVITGPGLTNALTAMGQAKADSIPMLVISGVNRRATLGKGWGCLHELPDQQAMVRALCPSFQISAPEELEPVLDAAFAALFADRPGPVHIEVPTDVMPMPAAELSGGADLRTDVISEGEIAAACQRLATAKRVVILAGGGTRHAAQGVQDLAERLDAPVVQTVNARGAMHGHDLVVPASPSLDAVRDLIAEADCVLALGTELGPTDYDMYVRGGLPDLSGMIRVDCSTEQLDRHAAAVKVRATVSAAIPALLAGLPTRPAGDGAARAKSARKAALEELARLDAAMPARLTMVEAIRSACPGAIIVGDSTQPIYAANLYYDHDRPSGWFNAATGFGALGFGPGAAIGAALAAPGARVICLVGDGGLQFSPGELRTAVDEHLPITFVVWNNAAFGEIAEAMAGAGTEVIGCSPSPLKMKGFAESCDLPFQSVPAEPEALFQSLKRAGSGPSLIEVRAIANLPS